jgi:hypothetical protein
MTLGACVFGFGLMRIVGRAACGVIPPAGGLRWESRGAPRWGMRASADPSITSSCQRLTQRLTQRLPQRGLLCESQPTQPRFW